MNPKATLIYKLLLVVIYCTYGSEGAFRLGRTVKYGFLPPPPPPEGVTTAEGKGEVVVQEKWFTQRLNHFDNTDTRTWRQVS